MFVSDARTVSLSLISLLATLCIYLYFFHLAEHLSLLSCKNRNTTCEIIIPTHRSPVCVFIYLSDLTLKDGQNAAFMKVQCQSAPLPGCATETRKGQSGGLKPNAFLYVRNSYIFF